MEGATMRRKPLFLVSALGCVCFLVAAAAVSRGEGGEKGILDGVPPAAMKALKREAGKAEILRCDRQTEGGQAVFEALWESNGRKHEAKVTAGGTLIEREVVIEAKALPKAVLRAAKNLLEKGTDLKIERKTVVLYSVEGRLGEKDVELEISPTGEVIEGKSSREEGDER